MKKEGKKEAEIKRKEEAEKRGKKVGKKRWQRERVDSNSRVEHDKKQEEKRKTGAADYNQSHIVTITETKGRPPKLEGYEWQNSESKTSAGGVDIAVRNDLLPSTRQVTEEIAELNNVYWIEIQANNSSVYIGTFYGKQETSTKEENENEFAALTTQIKRLQQSGEIVLTGDFNAKLELEVQGKQQKESPRGKLLRQMLQETGTY